MKHGDDTPTEDDASDGSAWQCCFCGQTIREHDAEIAITHSDGGVQGFHSHPLSQGETTSISSFSRRR